MAWNGLGLYVLPPAFSPEVNGTVIDATRYNGLTSDVATGISQALNKNGENTPTANISWGGFKLTNLAQAVVAGDALAWGMNASVLGLIVTGQIVAPQGAVGAPSYSFAADTNTGMWSPAGDSLAWSTNGAERMRIDSAGLIGMGGAATRNLSVFGGAGTAYLQLTNNTAGVGSAQGLELAHDGIAAYILQREAGKLSFDVNGSERMQISSGGLVGIGIVPATAVFDVAAANIAMYARSTNEANGTIFSTVNSNVGAEQFVIRHSVAIVGLGNVRNSHLDFFTNNTNRMRITDAGSIQDAAGLEFGWKRLPNASVATGAFVATDEAKCVYATGGVTIPNNTMPITSVVVIQNVTAGAITITKTITTAYNTNTGAAIGASFSLAARGRVAIIFTGNTECYISGNL